MVHATEKLAPGGLPPPEPSEVRADQQNRTCANDHGRTMRTFKAYRAARKYALRYIKLARRIRSRHVVGKNWQISRQT